MFGGYRLLQHTRLVFFVSNDVFVLYLLYTPNFQHWWSALVMERIHILSLIRLYSETVCL